jgi:hypothetical protein
MAWGLTLGSFDGDDGDTTIASNSSKLAESAGILQTQTVQRLFML